MGRTVLHSHHDLVPFLRSVLFQRFVGPGQEVIAALELRFADEDTAVGIGCGPKLELEFIECR